MSFSNEWDEIYRSNQQLSIWPWSDLVSYVMRYVAIDNTNCKVLELGCGAGANIPLFEKLSLDYYAVDGSEKIISDLINRFPNLSNTLRVSDFTENIPFNEKFNLIFDRASITHNSTGSIQKTIRNIKDKLLPGGYFIGIDWFSTEHYEFANGAFVDDSFTKNNYVKGRFLGVGKVHFSDVNHISQLFHDFEIIKIEKKLLIQEYPDEKATIASLNFIVKNDD